MGLLFGGGDPMRTLKITTLAGRDNDCNPASAMGVLGTMMGFKALPQELVSGINTLNGRKFAYTKYGWQKAISVMADKAYENIALNGGEKKTENGVTVLIIPVKPPVQLPLEQWPYTMPAASVPLPEYKY